MEDDAGDNDEQLGKGEDDTDTVIDDQFDGGEEVQGSIQIGWLV